MNLFVTSLQEPIAIVGMGISGQAVKTLLRHVAPNKRLLTYDSQVSVADFDDFNKLLAAKPKTMIVSPGVALNSPDLLAAKAAGIKITSELEVAFSLITTEKIIGISGSVGKSTTTALLERASQSVNGNNLAVGNIGRPLASYILQVLQDETKKASWLSLELSSFQLENFKNLKCDVSALTFFTPNHMERYSNLNNYYETKWSLVKKTNGVCYLNADSIDLLKFSKDNAGDTNIKLCFASSAENSGVSFSGYQLLGEHNKQNLFIVLQIIEDLGWGPSAIDAIKNFKGLPHRLENLGTINGVTFINDSKATAIDSVRSAVRALRTLPTKGNFLYVLIGGKDKNLPWEQLEELKHLTNVKPIYFGQVGEKAKQESKIDGQCFSKLAMAMEFSLKTVKSGDFLLLSPGGASQDEFKNFEERGDFFKKSCLSFR